ncbi:MAG: hypothetical protein ABI539_04655, partial [Acidobacteriota bacterium]
KQCPSCKTTYTDESLRFCLADGGTLISLPDEEETLIRGGRDIRVRVSPDTDSGVEKSSSGIWWKLAIGVVILGILALTVAGLAGALFYYGTAKRDDIRTSVSPTPAATPSQAATPDTEKQRLADELANIQKKLEEQQRSAANTDLFPTPASPNVPTARVNSPNDGFLALRSEPNADYGERLAKIPHGALVELNDCETESTTIGGRTGRWCLVTYRDHTGWVFDAWLVY